MSVFSRDTRDAQGLGMTSQRARARLIERLRAEGIKDHRVLDAIAQVPRHLYIDEGLESRAYEDTALPIGLGQTISQPWVVARMTEAIIEHGVPRKVLEIGTGSGYQAAVLARIVPEVCSVERIHKLLRQ
ncbi:MAG: protein-L-isoaspartate O-methyltransferase, partial [Xanthomonadales bacterium]|nr:protein-L-isoaspartate O-methyltransferase [Xanthomonadales bacterium]